MNRVVLLALIAMSLIGTAYAQRVPVSFESMLIDGASDGLLPTTISPGAGGTVSYCAGTVLNAAFNYRLDGTAPTSADNGGDRAAQNSFFEIAGADSITAFRAIRVTATSAIWNAHCYR